MMQPNFYDVLEYVKAGEVDPEMGEMLQHNPDGQELLKQARFICKMLQHQYESSDDGDSSADIGDVAASFGRVAESSRMESMREMPERLFYKEASPRLRPRQSSSIEYLVESTGRTTEDLGTLEHAIEGEQLNLSYEPSVAAMKFVAALADSDRIQIPAGRFTLSLPRTQPVGDSAVILVQHRNRNAPAGNVNLIFMPESGPFKRYSTDSNGLFSIRLSGWSGILRIETPIPQILHIKAKT
jgi:hypothetical protein